MLFSRKMLKYAVDLAIEFRKKYILQPMVFTEPPRQRQKLNFLL